MIDIIRVFINGLSLGGVYALIALGYTMVYGIAKMLNFAHGDIIMVGGYTIVVCLNTLGFHPLLCVLGAVVVCVAVGVVMEKLAYKPLRGSYRSLSSSPPSATAICCKVWRRSFSARAAAW